MKTITLVCTAHTENGLCNEHELLRILRAIGPDVIFEELRPSDFDRFYGDESKHTLEMRAITKYLVTKSARQVPVDDYEMPESFRMNLRALDRFVESRSPEYCSLMDEMHQMKFEYGFRYLNSPIFVAHINKSNQLFQEAVLMSDCDELKKLLSIWNEQLRRRNDSMLKNINDFCRKSSFIEGLFLVGAGHMSSILEGIESRITQEAPHVSWKIWNRL